MQNKLVYLLKKAAKGCEMVLKGVFKRLVKEIKRSLKTASSLRIGVRPEFISGIKQMRNFRNFGNIRNIRRIGKISLIRFIKSLQRRKLARVVEIVLPAVSALLIFSRLTPISAQLTGYEERLNSFLLTGDITAMVEKDADLSDQVYFLFEGEKNFVTDSKNAKEQVFSRGEYITWTESVDGYWQIFLYHIPTKTKTQLTYVGNNINPKVSGGKVAWQGVRVGAEWQIFLYDGTSIGPITSGDVSFTPDINGSFVVYSRKDVNNQWRSSAYSINDRKSIDIDFGDDNEYVSLKNKDIFIGFKGKSRRFNLNVEDLMLLDLGSLSSQPSTEIESIQREIDALTQKI